MNSLRARSVPAQLIVGMRARSASGVATSALSPIAGPTIITTPCSTSSAKACSIANAVPAGRPKPAASTNSTSRSRRPRSRRSSMASRMIASLCAAERRILLGRVGHVVQDADAYRCSHGMQHRTNGRARIESARRRPHEERP